MNRIQKARKSQRYVTAMLILMMTFSLFGCAGGKQTEGKTYSCEVTMTGGSGRASVESPASVMEDKDGKKVQLVWSSSFYDYMIVDGKKYMNEAKSGQNSTFTIPFEAYDKEFSVIGDTTAMSEPHEIQYRITVHAPNQSEGKSTSDSSKSTDTSEDSVERGNITKAPSIPGLKHKSSVKLAAAKEFTMDRYEKDGRTYTLLIIGAKDLFFLIPEGGAVPKNLPKNITTLETPLQKSYVVSTSVMDPIRQVGGLSGVSYTGTKAADWHVPGVSKRVKSGKIQYAGKYSAPDYELLRSGGCDLAIENTMIYHSPAVKEKLESLGIPVMVERSSYEKTPLGRLEWVKLFGALYGKEEAANDFFTGEQKKMEKISGQKSNGKTVAVFAINSSGGVTVRASGDYLSAMIRSAGGKYITAEPDSKGSAHSTWTIQMEDFYRIAKKADILIYNSTIEDPIRSLGDLKRKSGLLKKFRAVKSGQVYCLEPGFFQNSTRTGDFVEEMNGILNGKNRNLKILTKLKK